MPADCLSCEDFMGKVVRYECLMTQQNKSKNFKDKYKKLIAGRKKLKISHIRPGQGQVPKHQNFLRTIISTLFGFHLPFPNAKCNNRFLCSNFVRHACCFTFPCASYSHMYFGNCRCAKEIRATKIVILRLLAQVLVFY